MASGPHLSATADHRAAPARPQANTSNRDLRLVDPTLAPTAFELPRRPRPVLLRICVARVFSVAVAMFLLLARRPYGGDDSARPPFATDLESRSALTRALLKTLDAVIDFIPIGDFQARWHGIAAAFTFLAALVCASTIRDWLTPKSKAFWTTFLLPVSVLACAAPLGVLAPHGVVEQSLSLICVLFTLHAYARPHRGHAHQNTTQRALACLGLICCGLPFLAYGFASFELLHAAFGRRLPPRRSVVLTCALFVVLATLLASSLFRPEAPIVQQSIAPRIHPFDPAINPILTYFGAAFLVTQAALFRDRLAHQRLIAVALLGISSLQGEVASAFSLEAVLGSSCLGWIWLFSKPVDQNFHRSLRFLQPVVLSTSMFAVIHSDLTRGWQAWTAPPERDPDLLAIVDVEIQSESAKLILFDRELLHRWRWAQSKLGWRPRLTIVDGLDSPRSLHRGSDVELLSDSNSFGGRFSAHKIQAQGWLYRPADGILHERQRLELERHSVDRRRISTRPEDAMLWMRIDVERFQWLRARGLSASALRSLWLDDSVRTRVQSQIELSELGHPSPPLRFSAGPLLLSAPQQNPESLAYLLAGELLASHGAIEAALAQWAKTVSLAPAWTHATVANWGQKLHRSAIHHHHAAALFQVPDAAALRVATCAEQTNHGSTHEARKLWPRRQENHKPATIDAFVAGLRTLILSATPPSHGDRNP